MRLKNLAIVAALVLGFASSAFAGQSIKVSGSTTILPIMQRVIEAYMKAHPDVEIAVSGGGSSNGIKALLDGTTDIAMASRTMKDKEMKLAEEKGLSPKQVVIALDAVIPIVNKSNPVSDLTIEQLQAIYAGKVTNWKEVGGNDEGIVVVSRDTSSGTYETWSKFVMGKTRVFPGALLQASSGAVLQAVSKNPRAISYDGIGYVDSSVKALTVNGVEGNDKTAKDKSFPIARTLQVYIDGNPSGATKGLIDFILSPEGQNIVKEAGFIKL
ncbi:phosphate ABC transporter substrate-binding protein [Oleidesulfovibrio sp.]|uniref:phosphate ABC transporter substrate-binding protein n=1 Tax=Oleidesulfovibrio sp. TaxID=2909707 RepID=UPI003A84D888